LNDCIHQQIERANDVDLKDNFNEGIRFGFYSSISHLLNQAEAFQIINQLDKDIQEFVPEILLQRKADMK
jgi:hypothetical protein